MPPNLHHLTIMAKLPSPETTAAAAATPERECCGVVMPISSTPEYPESHWSDVLTIITDAADKAGFAAKMVSASNDAAIIHKNIIQNLYENPIVVCDVSSKNANVMLELGMRLAFDKPTIVIKDDKTAYTFDASPIEHLSYPRDLRHNKIEEFKATLAGKIRDTHALYKKDPGKFPSFFKLLGGFTDYKPAKIATTEVSRDDYLLEQVKQMQASIAQLGSNQEVRPPRRLPAIVPIEGLKLLGSIEFGSPTSRDDVVRCVKNMGISTFNLSPPSQSGAFRLTVGVVSEEQLHALGKYIESSATRPVNVLKCDLTSSGSS